MPFGPSDIGVVLQGVGALAQAAAIGFAAWMAANTYNNWRKQKLSERRIDQAERILTATYQVRRGLSRVRNNAIWTPEFLAAEELLKAAGHWPEDKDKQDQMLMVQVYYSRLNSCIDDRIALEQCQPMARTLFGEELENALDALNRHFHLVRVTVDSKRRSGSRASHEQHERWDSVLHEGGDEEHPNKMDKEISEQVDLIEGMLFPIMRLEGTTAR